MDVLRTIADVNITCFANINKKMKEIGNVEKSLISIPNVIVFCNLLIVNPATSYTRERSFSTTRRLKTRLRSKMTSRRFSSLGLLNADKELADKLELAEVGNEFISLNEEAFQYFGNFIEFDFTESLRLVCFIYSQHRNHRSGLKCFQ